MYSSHFTLKSTKCLKIINKLKRESWFTLDFILYFWKIYCNSKFLFRPSETLIFHLTSSTYKPFKWNIVAGSVDRLLHKYPLKSAVWYPTLKLLPSLFVFKLSALFFHWIPAYFLDAVTALSGGRPMSVIFFFFCFFV